MKISAGEEIPSFSIQDVRGNTITQEDLKGKKTLLTFYRYAACPFCNLRVHELLKKFPSSQEKLQVIGVFESPADSINKLIDKQNVSFPLIPDPTFELYKKFKVQSSAWGFIKGSFDVKNFARAIMKGFLPGKIEGSLTMMPADFLIDENLVCHTAYYGSYMSDHLDVKVIEAWLSQNAQEQTCRL